MGEKTVREDEVWKKPKMWKESAQGQVMWKKAELWTASAETLQIRPGARYRGIDGGMVVNQGTRGEETPAPVISGRLGYLPLRSQSCGEYSPIQRLALFYHWEP